jgi:hypothetical protein
MAAFEVTTEVLSALSFITGAGLVAVGARTK